VVGFGHEFESCDFELRNMQQGNHPQIQGIPLCHSLISLSLALSPIAHDPCSPYRMALKLALEINHTSCIGVSIHEPLLSVSFVTTKFINDQYWP